MIKTKQSAYQTLVQSTFGPTEQEIEALQGSTVNHWVDQQVALPQNYFEHLFKVTQNLHDKEEWTDIHLNAAWYMLAIEKEDQLRSRLAYTLTQLFVVSKNVPSLRSHPRKIAFANYFDTVATYALGSFRDLIGAVARHPIMGEFLTYRDNNYVEGRKPDENFARELMQLFTIGPHQLNLDGTVVTDESNQPIATYTQQDIEQLARVFTGWTLNDDNWQTPMLPIKPHDAGAKQILDFTINAGLNAEQEMDIVLDELCDHRNTAPYVSKFLIQKMVTANPSPDYVRSVATVFRQSQGDMVEVIKSILNHNEAQSTATAYAGKLRDPELVFIHAHRALGVTRPSETTWPNYYTWTIKRTEPMSSPTVFYHYQPSDSPNHPLFREKANPEALVYQWADYHEYHHLLYRVLLSHGVEYDQQTFIDDYLAMADDALVDTINDRLFGGTLSSTAIEAIHNFLAHYPTEQSRKHRTTAVVRQLLLQLITSSQFCVQGR